jgi:hypothetical protein
MWKQKGNSAITLNLEQKKDGYKSGSDNVGVWLYA